MNGGGDGGDEIEREVGGGIHRRSHGRACGGVEISGLQRTLESLDGYE